MEAGEGSRSSQVEERRQRRDDDSMTIAMTQTFDCECLDSAEAGVAAADALEFGLAWAAPAPRTLLTPLAPE